MPISVTCTHCGASFGVKDKHAGMSGRCPKCSGIVQVPAAPQTDELDTSWLDDVETDAPVERAPPPRAAQPRETQRHAPTAPAAVAAAKNGAIEFHCGKCGAGFKVAASLAGRTAKCQKCGESLRVPAVSEPRAAAPAAAPVIPSRPQPHFPNPLATPARKAAPPPVDDLLSELGEGFGVAATEQPLPARRDPFASTSLPPAKVKSRRNRSTFSLGLSWPDYTFLSLCGVGAFLALWSGVWSFIVIPPAFLSIWIVVVAGFVHGEIALGVLSLLCTPCAYIIGWVKVSEWRLARVMIGWSLAMPLSLVAMLHPAITAAQAAAEKNAAAKRAAENGPHVPRLGEDVAPRGANASNIPPAWQIFDFAEADCRVALPVGKRRQYVQPAPGTPIDRLVMHVTESQGGKVAHCVAYSDPPLSIDESSVQEALRLVGPGGLSRTFRVTGEHPVQVAGKPGLWLDVDVEGDPGVHVVFAARGRIYLLAVNHAASASEHAYMQHFVDSFQFITPEAHLPPQGFAYKHSLVGSVLDGSRSAPDLAASPAPTDGNPAPAFERENRSPEEQFAEALEELASDTPQVGLMRLAKMQPNDQRSKVIEAVLPLLTSRDDSLRLNALEVLSVWGTEQELPAMIDLLDDAEGFVQHAAMEAVSRFKTAAAAEAIAERLPHDKFEVERALCSMGEVAAPAVARYLQHPDEFTRMTACKILEEIGTVESAAELFKLEHDPSGLVVSAADQAIRAIRFRHKVDTPAGAASGRPSPLRPVKPK